MQITTERLLLREFVAEDWPAVLAYQRKPEYLRYYPWVERTPAESQTFVRMFLAQQQVTPRRKFQLAVVLRDADQLIGNCGVRVENAAARQGSLGYELDPAYWGHGYATEAARAMLAFGFRELGLHRVWAECLAENRGSARVLEKLGLRREARLRDHEWFKDRWWDALIYGILEHEWRAPVAAGAG